MCDNNIYADCIINQLNPVFSMSKYTRGVFWENVAGWGLVVGSGIYVIHVSVLSNAI